MADLGQILNVQAQKLARIRSGEVVRRAELVEKQRQFDVQQANRNQILEMFRTAFADAGGEGAGAIPAEFATNVGLFQPGGQFGTARRTEADIAGQRAIAAGQIGLTQTGMSSGTNVAGLTSRVAFETARARERAEDERIARLGGALTQAGQAKLTAKELASRERQAFLQSLGSFG